MINMADILVLKIGGSILSDRESMNKATNTIKSVLSRGFSVAVVVSAMKGVTDQLLSEARKKDSNASPETIAEILSTGEMTSARILTEVLNAENISATLVDPNSTHWPIFTDNDYLDANPIYKDIKNKVEEEIRPLIEKGIIPVICGFLGISPSGKITTMGRGGSDTTAVLMGSSLGAKEIVLIKDVDTIFSSDPDQVDNPIALDNLDSDEAYALASGGAKFLHAKALRYINKDTKIRISSLSEDEFRGTVIDGGNFNLEVEKSDENVSMITIVGERAREREQLQLLVNTIEKASGRVISFTLDPRAFVAYVSGGVGLLNQVHDFVVKNKFGKAVSSFEDLSIISVKGRALETSPGMIQRVTQPLAKHRINVYGVLTITSSIRILVSRDQEEMALSMLRESLVEI